MCGIAGVFGGATGVDISATAGAMADAIAHRGPDDRGVWCDAQARVALAHRRLSVIDLSPAGHQPMPSHSGRYVIVFNGEIYNHLEMRRELDSFGGREWRGHSDTETFLAACDQFGVRGALRRSVGMFAFALWDCVDHTLYLARDRVGEKPLYWGRTKGGAIAFGSELKAIVRAPGVDREIDRDALALYMRHNYVPAPHSIYKGVRKLGAGELLCVSGDYPTAHAEKYWSAHEVVMRALGEPFMGDEVEATDELERLLLRSVGQQMVSDVPLGAFLSGGIDSTTVVALMQAQSARPIKTFTIGFNEEGYNEAVHAKSVAGYLGTDHTELYVNPAQAQAVIPRLPTIYDEPFADSSQIPTLLVSELARKHVTVGLSGDGGDELFGGYNRYLWTRSLIRRLGWCPRAIRALMGHAMQSVAVGNWDRVAQVLYPITPARLRYAQPGDKIHKLAEVLRLGSGHEIYMRFLSHWDEPQRLVRGTSDPLPSLMGQTTRLHSNIENEMMYFDLVNYLPDDILVKVDRAAMSVSLESRVPFLDHRIIEFAWRVPLQMKIRGGQGKWLLREVLHRHVPRALTDRPKVGFGVPIDSWLRGPLRDWAEALLDPQRMDRDGFLLSGDVTKAWSEHVSGHRNNAYLLWDVLMFQAWLENQ